MFSALWGSLVPTKWGIGVTLTLLESSCQDIQAGSPSADVPTVLRWQ